MVNFGNTKPLLLILDHDSALFPRTTDESGAEVRIPACEN